MRPPHDHGVPAASSPGDRRLHRRWAEAVLVERWWEDASGALADAGEPVTLGGRRVRVAEAARVRRLLGDAGLAATVDVAPATLERSWSPSTAAVTGPRPTGRRPGAPDTRQEILDAARVFRRARLRARDRPRDRAAGGRRPPWSTTTSAPRRRCRRRHRAAHGPPGRHRPHRVGHAGRGRARCAHDDRALGVPRFRRTMQALMRVAPPNEAAAAVCANELFTAQIADRIAGPSAAPPLRPGRAGAVPGGRSGLPPLRPQVTRTGGRRAGRAHRRQWRPPVHRYPLRRPLGRPTGP